MRLATLPVFSGFCCCIINLLAGSVSLLSASSPELPRLLTTVDPSFNTELDGQVFIVRQDVRDKLLVAGEFRKVSGQVQPGLARLNPDGTLDPAFHSEVPAGTIGQMLLYTDGRILVGGAFTNIGATARSKVARLNSDGALDSTFNPSADIIGLLWLQDDGRILAQQGSETVTQNGSMTSTFNGKVSLVRLQPDGSIDPTFNRALFSSKASFVLGARPIAQGNIIVAYHTIEYVFGSYLDTRYNALLDGNGVILTNPSDTLAWSAGSPGLKALPSGGMAVVHSDLFFGYPCQELFRVSADGSSRQLPSCGWPAGDYKDGRLIAGTNLFDATTNLLGTLDYRIPTVSYPEQSAANDLIVQADGRLVLGGSFLSLNGAPLPYLARLITQTNAGPPVITFSSPGQRVDAGADVWLSVQVESQEAVTYEWQKKGLPLLGQVYSSLVISNVQPGDSGESTVLVRNNSGQALSPVASLEVLGGSGPTIVSDPSSATVFEGSKVTFSVSVNNSLQPRYQWQFNGAALGKATNSSLVLTPVLSSQAGEYRTVVSDDFGASTSNVAILTVVARPLPAGSHDISLFPGPDIDSRVDAVAFGPEGKIYIAGSFTNRVQGHSRYLIARLNQDGAIDDSFWLKQQDAPAEWGRVVEVVPSPDGGVVVRVVANSWVSCGGPCAYVPVSVAKLRSDGAVESGFSTLTWFAHALAATREGDLLVASDGAVLRSVVQLGSVNQVSFGGQANPNFKSPQIGAAPFPGFLRAASLDAIIELPDGQFVLAGSYGLINDVVVPPIVRLRPNGTLDIGFIPSITPLITGSNQGANPRILAAQSDSRVLLVSSTGQLRRLTEAGEVDQTFSDAVSNVEGVLALANDSLLVWGSFTNLQGAARHRIARLHPNGEVDQSFDPELPDAISISSVAEREDGVIAVAGSQDSTGRVLLLYPRQTLSSSVSAQGFTVRFPTLTGLRYVLESKDQLSNGNWVAGEALLGTGLNQELVDARSPGTQRYYRVRVEKEN